MVDAEAALPKAYAALVADPNTETATVAAIPVKDNHRTTPPIQYRGVHAG
jgi:hypothetical protein